MPFAKKFRKPIITGVEILVVPKFKFGTFAVIPDPVQLGNQAAQIIFDAMDNDWEVETGEVEPPRSVYKIINLKQAERLFGVNKEQVHFFFIFLSFPSFTVESGLLCSSR